MHPSRIFLAIGLPLLLSSLLSGCGSGGSTGTDPTRTSTVSVYLTDDLAGYESVLMTVNTVQLQHRGGGRLCTIIPGPLTLDAAQLGRLRLVVEGDRVSRARADAPVPVEIGEGEHEHRIAFERR